MKTTKLTAVLLSILMLTGIFGITGLAEDTVTLTVGEGKEFTTLLDAFDEAIEKKYTNITYEIYGKQVLPYSEDGSIYPVCVSPWASDVKVQEVHFTGMDETAGIFLNDSRYLQRGATDTTGMTAYTTEYVTFSNLTLDHNKDGAVSGSSDRRNSYWFIVSGDNVTYTNCKFLNRTISYAKNTIYRECDFINYYKGSYALFYSGDNWDGMGGSLVIDGCNFTGTRAVKTYSDDLYNGGSRAVLSTLTVKDSTFTVNEKAALENTEAIMEGAKITITGNTFNFCKAVNDAASIGTTDEEIAKNNQFDLIRPRASVSFTEENRVYQKEGQTIEALTDGAVTAKADVKNNLTKNFSVSMITAEYTVSEDGVKTLVQVKKDTKEIPAGESVSFENTLTVTETKGHFLQTMLVADDTLEPIGSVISLLTAEGEAVIYLGSEPDEDNVTVSTYQVNRFEEQ